MTGFRVGIAGIAGLIALVAVWPCWPVVLIAGCSPVFLLILAFARGGRRPLPAWPDQCALLAAALQLAALLLLRLILMEHATDLELAGLSHAAWGLLCAASCLCGVLATRFFRQAWSWGGTVFLYGLLSLASFYAAFAMLDIKLDAQAPLSVRSAVIAAKDIRSNGKSTYGVLLLRGSPQSGMPSEQAVTWPVFQQASAGSAICRIEHAGALGAAWYQTKPCR